MRAEVGVGCVVVVVVVVFVVVVVVAVVVVVVAAVVVVVVEVVVVVVVVVLFADRTSHARAHAPCTHTHAQTPFGISNTNSGVIYSRTHTGSNLSETPVASPRRSAM